MTRKEILSIARPILFNTDMVRAVLEKRKSVTRRVIKPQPPQGVHIRCRNDAWEWFWWVDGERRPVSTPYKIGDCLYVRETWSEWTDGYVYRAWTEPFPQPGRCADEFMKWHPSIHMPKEAARIFLRVTDVRVERLQNMTSDDSEREGCSEYLTESKFRVSSLGHFMEVWNSTIPKKDMDKYGWEANPWVWVIQFEKLEIGE